MGLRLAKEDLLMEKISSIRKKAASDALQDLTLAFNKVKDRYDRKHQLRTVLQPPKTAQSLTLLANHLKAIRDNATQVYASSVGGSILDDRIEIPIRWAEEQLKQLQTIIEQARELALDLNKFAIDKTTLDLGTATLCSAGDDRLNEPTYMTAGLGKVWEEAFELAGGICLRHEGLDDGLCQVAEALIEETNWIKGKAFAIPSRNSVGVLPNVIHLPFPEWTIWALPLTAHEVWRLRIRNKGSGQPDRLLRAILEDAERKNTKEQFAVLKESAPSVWGVEEFQACMGDVFGMFTLGPAYACACIDLALDPNQESSKERALTLFHCLRLDDELRTTLEILEGQWQDVLSDQKLDTEENLASLYHGKPKYETWITAVTEYLRSNAGGFIVDRWRKLRGPLMDALRLSVLVDPGKSFEPGGIDPNKMKFKYLISAAWKTRLEFPPETDQIAKRCKQLADWLLAEQPTKTTSLL
jgi:hypothetical protein